MRIFLCLFFGSIFFHLIGQSVKPITLEELQQQIDQVAEDQVYVINFWATWCKPCLEELPYFEAIHEKYADQGVHVRLVSLDFESKFEATVIPYIEKKGYTAPVFWMNESDGDKLINGIHESWTGAIPATYVIKGSAYKKFYEQAFTQQELENIVQPLIR